MTNIPSKDEFLSRYVAEYTDGSFMFLYLRSEERTPCVGEHTVGVTAFAEFTMWDTEDQFEEPSAHYCLRHMLESLDYAPRDVVTEAKSLGRVRRPYLHLLSEDHRAGRYVAVADGWLALWNHEDLPTRNHTQGASL